MESLIKKFKYKPSKFSISRASNPHKDWVMLVGIFCIATVSLIAFSLFILYQIKNEQIFQTSLETLENPSVLKDKLLIKVNESFQEKALMTETLEKDKKAYIDPSL